MGLGKDVITKPFGFLPFLRFVPPYRSKFQRLSKSFQGNLKINFQKILPCPTNIFSDFTKFMEAAIKEHEESLDENNPRDFIDMFLIQSKNDTRQIYTKKQLIR